MVTSLIINGLSKVELWVEYGWNYMKFHPNSTTNSTAPNTLILIVITPPWWKSGITNDKKYFSWKRAEKLWIDVNFTTFHGNPWCCAGYVGDKIRSILIIRVRFTTEFFSNTDLSDWRGCFASVIEYHHLIKSVISQSVSVSPLIFFSNTDL